MPLDRAGVDSGIVANDLGGKSFNLKGCPRIRWHRNAGSRGGAHSDGADCRTPKEEERNRKAREKQPTRPRFQRTLRFSSIAYVLSLLPFEPVESTAEPSSETISVTAGLISQTIVGAHYHRCNFTDILVSPGFSSVMLKLHADEKRRQTPNWSMVDRS